MLITGLLIGFTILVGGFVIIAYNLMVRARQLADNGWADIDVQLKRRADLIPSLTATVGAYAGHERRLLADIADKRTAALNAGDDAAARGAAEAALARPVAQLLAVAEDYPELKASENFLSLQRELSETENTIEMARRFYNGAVRQLNVLVESFPLNLVARLLGFKKRDYFEIDGAHRTVPGVALEADS